MQRMEILTDVVVMSKSGFCLVIKGRRHHGVVCCLLGGTNGLITGVAELKVGAAKRACMTLDRDPICWMCMFI